MPKQSLPTPTQRVQHLPSRQQGRVSPILLLVVILVLAGAGAAWWYLQQGGEIGLPGSEPVVDVAGEAGQQPVEPVDSQALSLDELNRQARRAMADKRIVAPAGNNAVEYYLAILERQPGNNAAIDAIRELFPFATGTAEEQINQGDFDEAGRIIDLLARADSSNYTLTILRSKLDGRRRLAEREQAQQQAQATAQAQAAAARAAEPATAPLPETSEPAQPVASAPAQAAEPVAAAPATPAPAPAAAAPATPAPAPPPAVAGGETRDARVITPPRPTYPAAAARNRQNGSVELEFTVAADGSVQNVKVISSTPPRVFDREAINAMQKARFEPRLQNGQAVESTLRRRIEFQLGD